MSGADLRFLCLVFINVSCGLLDGESTSRFIFKKSQGHTLGRPCAGRDVGTALPDGRV